MLISEVYRSWCADPYIDDEVLYEFTVVAIPCNTRARRRTERFPAVTNQRDDIAADTPARAAEKLAASAQAVIKPWVLPTGNSFIKDPARRFARPAGSVPRGCAACSPATAL